MRCTVDALLRKGLQTGRGFQDRLQHVSDRLKVLAVTLLSIFSGGLEAVTHQPFGVGPVGKSEKIEKARLFLQAREHIIRHLSADLHTLLEIPQPVRT